jgi:hypothetical protein
MPVDLQKFANTATELYALWPALFNWLGGIVIGTLAFMVTSTWWVRGYMADRDIAILKNEKATLEREKTVLKGQFDAEKVLLNARLESEIKALNAKADAERTAAQGLIQVLEQRLQLAVDQNAAAKDEARRAKDQLTGLREAARSGGSLKDLQVATTHLDTSFDKIIHANSAVSDILTFPLRDIEVVGQSGLDNGAIKLPTIKLPPRPLKPG